MPIDPESLTLGFVLGFAAASLIGGILGRINRNRGASRRSGQKASVTVKAEKSPSEIMADAAKASMRAVGWFLLLVITVVAFGYLMVWVWG